MGLKVKTAIFGAAFLALCLFAYFSIRFTYTERDIIASYRKTTERVVAEYKAYEKKAKRGDADLSPRDLSGFLKLMHAAHGDIALLAITDDTLSVRVSSKNSRFIRSSYLFEALLRDFTRESLNITRERPYSVRYYPDDGGENAAQRKYYLFLVQIGNYNLLAVYPYRMSDTILIRTVLELSLLVVVSVMLSLVLYISLNSGRLRSAPAPGPITIDLGASQGSIADAQGGAARHTSRVASESLVEFVHGQFKKIHDLCDSRSISLYISHASGKLIKTMELTGAVFMRIDSLSFDTIDPDDDVGGALREGATMLLEDGSRLLLPLMYNGSFLGVVMITGKEPFQGPVIQMIREETAGIVKNLNDFLALNDVMIDSSSGLHSKTYFHFKYDECLASWKSHGTHFSIMFVELFDKNVQIDEGDKNRVIKLIAPALLDCVKNKGPLCRYDDYIALILSDVNMKMAKGMGHAISAMLARYRVRDRHDSIITLQPSVDIASTDSTAADMDPLGHVRERLARLS